MNMDLTLLVTLKDRAEFTKRLCHYLSSIKYPYPVIFADGSLEDDNQIFLKEFSKTSQFKYTYTRYPKDLILSDYYKKCAEAVSQVKTPYVMMADNDDFPIPYGQGKAVEFLKHNPSYVGCNGRVAGVVIGPEQNQLNGLHVIFLPYYCYSMDASVDLDQNLATDRIKNYLRNFYSIFYSIYRTESLKISLNKVQELNFSELDIKLEYLFGTLRI